MSKLTAQVTVDERLDDTTGRKFVGSESDWPTMKLAADALAEFGVARLEEEGRR